VTFHKTEHWVIKAEYIYPTVNPVIKCIRYISIILLVLR
jgi:hypothetical protein